MQNLPDIPVKLIVRATLAVSVLIVVLLLIISAFSGRSDRNRQPAAVAAPQVLSPLEQIIGPLQLHHFIIPNPEEQYMNPQIIPFRETGSPWSEEEIEPFWLDPLMIGLEETTKENRRLIQELYENIP
ncbi:hypothetical protein [Spirochaeta dissipatitropha]